MLKIINKIFDFFKENRFFNRREEEPCETFISPLKEEPVPVKMNEMEQRAMNELLKIL